MKTDLARFHLKIFSLITRNLSLSKKYLDEIIYKGMKKRFLVG
jgi:hypothetical protein